MDDKRIEGHTDQSQLYFVLQDGRLLEATQLSATLSDMSHGNSVTLDVRVLTPDVLLDVFNSAKGKHISNLIIDNLGNPEPGSPEMWNVLDWCLLLRLATLIKPTILRDRKINLDIDVLYTTKGAKCVRGTKLDSPERQRIEANYPSTSTKFWSKPIAAIREYFKSLEEFNPPQGIENTFLKSNWAMLRAAAELDGIPDEDATQLFCRATYQPYPLIIPFGDEEANRWRREELDSVQLIEEKLEQTLIEQLSQTRERLLLEMENSSVRDRAGLERKLRRAERFLEHPNSSRLQKQVQRVRKDIYNQIWQKAREINLREYAGSTIPLAQSLEYEMQFVWQTTLGWFFRDIYRQLRNQMTRAERRLFVALYIPNSYTAFRVPTLDQTVLDFIQCASEETTGVALCVLAGIKRFGDMDLAGEFVADWKTWLWLCDLIRGCSIQEISKALKDDPKVHQFMKHQVIEVSLDDEQSNQLLDRLLCANGTSGIFIQDRLGEADNIVEEEVLQHVIDEYPVLLGRLINQYTTLQQRKVLLAKYFPQSKELTESEIASSLGISQPAVSQHLQAGLRRIIKGMRDEEESGVFSWHDVTEHSFEAVQ